MGRPAAAKPVQPPVQTDADGQRDLGACAEERPLTPTPDSRESAVPEDATEPSDPEEPAPATSALPPWRQSSASLQPMPKWSITLDPAEAPESTPKSGRPPVAKVPAVSEPPPSAKPSPVAKVPPVAVPPVAKVPPPVPPPSANVPAVAVPSQDSAKAPKPPPFPPPPSAYAPAVAVPSQPSAKVPKPSHAKVPKQPSLPPPLANVPAVAVPSQASAAVPPPVAKVPAASEPPPSANVPAVAVPAQASAAAATVRLVKPKLVPPPEKASPAQDMVSVAPNWNRASYAKAKYGIVVPNMVMPKVVPPPPKKATPAMDPRESEWYGKAGVQGDLRRGDPYYRPRVGNPKGGRHGSRGQQNDANVVWHTAHAWAKKATAGKPHLYQQWWDANPKPLNKAEREAEAAERAAELEREAEAAVEPANAAPSAPSNNAA